MLGRWFSPLLTTVVALAAFVVIVPDAAAADRKAPTAPKNVRLISKADTSIEIAWSRSNDNVRVAGYGLYRNGVRVATTTSTSYRFSALACAASYTLGVDAYDATGNRSRVTSITASTVACAPSPSVAVVSYPSSYFTGPLGKNNILPTKNGAFIGIWPQGTIAGQQAQITSREQLFGRTLDFVHVHHGAPTDGCYYAAPFSQGREKWVADRGSMPMISWTHGWTLDQVNAGQADACLRDVGARFAAWGRPILLRIYWEFNGSWFRWSGTGTKFISAWRRTVDVMRSAGATNVGFVWSPDEGYFGGTLFQSYPGDNYVDWVASDRYNWNTNPWRSFETLFDDSNSGAAKVHDYYGPTKPYMVAETGSVEDASNPGRKGQWHRDARDAIKARFPYLKAFLYFDVDVTSNQGVNWKLDTSQSSLDGFRALALDPHFNTRSP